MGVIYDLVYEVKSLAGCLALWEQEQAQGRPVHVRTRCPARGHANVCREHTRSARVFDYIQACFCRRGYPGTVFSSSSLPSGGPKMVLHAQPWSLGSKQGGLHFEQCEKGTSRLSAARPELRYIKHAARTYLAGKPERAADARPHLLPHFDHQRVRNLGSYIGVIFGVIYGWEHVHCSQPSKGWEHVHCQLWMDIHLLFHLAEG
jgi:hypothetical protein